jgi:hypothetical protein
MECRLQRRVQRYGWSPVLPMDDAEFDEGVRERVRKRYLAAIAPWRHGRGYRVPGEFVIVSAAVPDGPGRIR